MTQQYETCYENIKKLVADYSSNKLDRNEATTRLQLIDRLLFECLGWSTADCITEVAHGGEYADYTCIAPRPMLIIEAKREGDYFELPAGQSKIDTSIQTLIRTYPNLKAAIMQVTRYCQSRGVTFAAVANGHQIVTFVAIRQDGPPLDGKALVFPSLQFMCENFLHLWDAISKSAIEEKRLEQRLTGKTVVNIPPKLSSSILSYPGTKSRNPFQTSLKIVSELVLEDIINAPELETQFLEECYCDSGAVSEYSLISRDVLQARYTSLFDEGQPGPMLTPAVNRKGIDPEILAKSISRRPILIIGDVGAGKTLFLRRLMMVEAADQFKHSITLHLNLGLKAIISIDLRVFIIDEIIRKLDIEYRIDIDELNVIKGVYHGELQRFAKGIYAPYKETNPQFFQEKETVFLENKISDRVEHLRNTLVHIQKARQKQIVIILDNSDQRDYETQQQVFLIAQEIASNWPATIFVTLRPETFHLSLRSGGALSGYHPKAFSIAPPRIDRVLEKRIPFGLKITRGEIPIPSLSNVSLQLESLATILNAFLETIVRRREIGELIDNVAGGNVRLALDLVQSFFGSGHVDTEKIVEICNTLGGYTVPIHEFLRAVMYGDNVHYDPSRSYIANIFDISSTDPKEHFIMLIALYNLSKWKGVGIQDGFVETGLFYDNLQSVGYTSDQIDMALVRAHNHKLIETAARRAPEPGKVLPPSLRITSVGAYHLLRLSKMFTYIDAVIVDTPIIDIAIRAEIRNSFNIRERLDRAIAFCNYLDSHWALIKAKTSFEWELHSSEIQSDIAIITQRL